MNHSRIELDTRSRLAQHLEHPDQVPVQVRAGDLVAAQDLSAADDVALANFLYPIETVRSSGKL